MTEKIPNDLIDLDAVLELTGLTKSGWRYIRNSGRAPDVRTYKVGKKVLFSHRQVKAWNRDYRRPRIVA